MLELDWLALGVAVKYQLPLDNSPQSTLMWKRHQAFSTHRRTLMSERLIKTPIRYYFDNIMERVKRKKNMITEKLIKKVLRKWLKKKLYINAPISTNITRFEWVYNSHLKEWRDRMWVIKNCPENRDKCLNEYLYS